jgi:hypothetical protein
MPEWISPGIKNVPLYIHPECNKKIDNYRRPHSEKGYVDKIFTYCRCGNTHSFANYGANPKYMPFYKVPEPLHTANLNRIFSINKHFK